MAGCISGLITIAGIALEQRPSEVIAGFMQASGASSLGEWFTSDLPVIATEPNGAASGALMNLAGIGVLVMLIGPHIRARCDEWDIDLQARGLIGSRVAATTWILVLCSQQVSDEVWGFELIRPRLIMALIVVALALLLLGALHVVARRFDALAVRYLAARSLTQKVETAGTVLIMAILALILAVVDTLLNVVYWLFSPESDGFTKMKLERVEDFYRKSRPTGAMPINRDER